MELRQREQLRRQRAADAVALEPQLAQQAEVREPGGERAAELVVPELQLLEPREAVAERVGEHWARQLVASEVELAVTARDSRRPTKWRARAEL